MTRPSLSPRTVLLGLVVLVAGLLGGLMANAALSGGTGGEAPAARAAAAQRFSPAALRAGIGPATNVVARARRHSIAVYRTRAAGRRPFRRLRARTISGRALPLVFLVEARRGGWLRVDLPTRPNLSRGWIRARDVSLATDRLHIRVQLRTHRLLVRDGRRVILRRRIGVGRSLSPTPTGRYYVTDLLRPPNPRGFYGPYAFGLSAHSPVYTTFAGGDGQVGLHGTSDPSALGRDVSHGCIRVDNATITRLARLVPLGTPVQIER